MEFNKQETKEKLKKWTLRILLGYLALLFIWVLTYRWVNPPGTFLMLSRKFSSENAKIRYDWVDYGNISSYLKVCAVASEDQNFSDHTGVDFDAIEKAVEYNKNHTKKRGASTITQQVAKNVFLWPSRSFVRKIFELQFTFMIEMLWPKERVMEVYLNVIEMGPMTFGAEAAAKRYFRKSASKLSLEESALLIAILPSPLKWSATKPGPYVIKRQRWIIRQYRMIGGTQYLKDL